MGRYLECGCSCSCSGDVMDVVVDGMMGGAMDGVMHDVHEHTLGVAHVGLWAQHAQAIRRLVRLHGNYAMVDETVASMAQNQAVVVGVDGRQQSAPSDHRQNRKNAEDV